mmetsp:Transcript_4127/g.4833  ORF Transcript_4127/g.4833 Transcript_4127/m.4833 type:complete len:153 (-) Transcript_4127:714-1172(-)|eukprot:CAMPEP_0185769020 /NCGR_PEP_ID=MMETSP1174-20130828/53315_1 /TAXON_ID=35687 /ORGANISM="Dictyocha speculum, Strain CCMP1381" /LENGTH=152 /DNA_ID=CAMNT_0028453951 /DNA_START=76 /DNA_END=534 /DNA_ORIENTATION=-
MISDQNNDRNIWIAASDGNISEVQQFLEANPNLLNAGDENGYTPMHAAASYNHQELIQMLLSAGASLDVRDTDGDTLLHHCDEPRSAEYLLSLGCNPATTNNEGKDAPTAHLENEDEAMITFWRAHGFLPPPQTENEDEYESNAPDTSQPLQ